MAKYNPVQDSLRRMIREEIQALFTQDVKNTSQNEDVSFSDEPRGRGFPKRRKRGSQGKAKDRRGMALRPDDKRLKANRTV